MRLWLASKHQLVDMKIRQISCDIRTQHRQRPQAKLITLFKYQNGKEKNIYLKW